MSFDVFFQSMPKNIKSIEELPDNFNPRPLGSKSSVRKRLTAAVPSLDFDRDGTGVVRGDGFSAEIFGADEDPCDGIMVALRGGVQGAAVIDAICRATGWRAVAPGVHGIICSGDDLGEGFAQWRRYRDQVVTKALKPRAKKMVKVKPSSSSAIKTGSAAKPKPRTKKRR